MRPIAVLVAAGVLASGAAGTQDRTRVLLTVNGAAVAFAQDGSRLAVATTAGYKRCYLAVRVHDLRTRRDRTITDRRGPTCEYGLDPEPNEFRFTYGGNAGLWVLATGAHFRYQDITMGTFSRGRDQTIRQLIYDGDAYLTGDHFGADAADGTTLVYGWYRVGVEGPDNCDETYTCTVRIAVGGVARVSPSGRQVRVPGTQAAFLVAASGRRVGYVRATPEVAGYTDPNPTTSEVEVRDSVTGEQFASFTVPGRATAIALGSGQVAVLATDDAGSRVFRYSAVDGALLGSTAVPPKTAPELSISRNRVVFRAGRTIWLLDARTDTARPLATTRRAPVGASIEGNRVAWAEISSSRPLRSVVRSVTFR
jgi:hypothetical protein